MGPEGAVVIMIHGLLEEGFRGLPSPGSSFIRAGQGVESFEHKRLQATTDATGEYLHTCTPYSSSLLPIEALYDIKAVEAVSSQGRLQSTEYAMHVPEGEMRCKHRNRTFA